MSIQKEELLFLIGGRLREERENQGIAKTSWLRNSGFLLERGASMKEGRRCQMQRYWRS